MLINLALEVAGKILIAVSYASVAICVGAIALHYSGFFAFRGAFL